MWYPRGNWVAFLWWLLVRYFFCCTFLFLMAELVHLVLQKKEEKLGLVYSCNRTNVALTHSLFVAIETNYLKASCRKSMNCGFMSNFKKLGVFVKKNMELKKL